MAKEVNKKTKTPKETINNLNHVEIEGVINKVIYATEKVAGYVLETCKTSPKGNNIKSWLTIKEFEPSIHYEKGDRVIIKDGEIATDSYEKGHKTYYNTVIVGTIEGIDVVETIEDANEFNNVKGGVIDAEIPFN